MASTQPTIVGEPFQGYVNAQITERQKIYGSGLNTSRTSEQISYLNSRNAFIKVASSVSINGERLSKIGLGNTELYGTRLAEAYVLFNTVGDGSRAGVARSNTLINNSAYGLGGTDFGLQPPPGIISFDISHINRGSIRKGELKLKAYNKNQFDIIETLYMRLGFTMLIEWGNGKYLDNQGILQNMGPTLTDGWWWNNTGKTHLQVQQQLEDYRARYDGNYDASFSRVVNFDWTYNTDGSYDISIFLVSIGSVVESFKVNTLRSSCIPRDEEDNEEENNESILSAYLKRVKKDFNKTEANSNYLEVRNRYYIRFLELLRYIETNVIDKLDGDPLIRLNTFPELFCNFIPNLISTNPDICLVNTSHLNVGPQDGFPNSINVEDIDFNSYTEFFKDPYGEFGLTQNIYLNFDFIIELLKNTDAGELDLFTFLSKICDGINSSFANICNFEPIYNEETHCIEIIDQNLPPNITPEYSRSIPSEEIIIYGYNNGESNFVRNYNLQTTISPQIVNQLSIGAAANNTSVNEDATAFSKWNDGLQDRFQLTRSEEKNNGEEANDTSPEARTTFQNFLTYINLIFFTRPTRTAKEHWERWLHRSFTSIAGSLLNFNTEITYFANGSSRKASGNATLSEYAKTRNKEIQDASPTKEIDSNILGFIPLELNLEIDGLSGIKIYNQLRIKTEFLPSNYPDIMEFVVTGLNHTISNQNWTTNITAIPKAT